MSDTEKNIPVRFITKAPYFAFDTNMRRSTLLGYISKKDVDQILTAATQYTPNNDSCIQFLSIDYINRTKVGNIPQIAKHESHVEISNVFWCDPLLNTCGRRCINCTTSDTVRAQHCAQSLSIGQCRDKFMRETFGAALYPHHYAKAKQK